jgi:tRNA-Thr(GGU) m(6)t(6)A37 methyltransferase TsaA
VNASTAPSFQVRAIGRVHSPLTDPGEAPLQADEGAPPATLELSPWALPALRGVAVGDEILVLTWLDRADRATMEVHPRGDVRNPVMGVFATRSPDRPNPIGIHRVAVVAIAGPEVRVSALEALDGTPIVDIKAVLGEGDR